LSTAPDGSPVELYAPRLGTDRVSGPVVHGTIDYVSGSRRWTHAFAMHVFADEAELDAALGEAGLRLEQWLDGADGRWFVAVGSAPPGL